MSFPPSTIYLVTGANRGIGLGLVEHIAAKHADAFIYAGARDPDSASALKSLSTKYTGRVGIVKCVSGDVDGNSKLAAEIRARHGRVDTVIANAGLAKMEFTVLDTPVESFKEHHNVNVIGTVVLFQAMHDLLKQSESPRFVPISTGGASIGTPAMSLPLGVAAYGSSKAALNYITRKMHFENEWLITFPLAPGIVETDAVTENVATDKLGVFEALTKQFPPQSPKEAAVQLIKIIDEATRDKDGGEFINIDGTKMPW